MTSNSDHAKQCAKSCAETIEALYELHCFDGSSDAAEDLTTEAADLAKEFGWGDTSTDIHGLRDWLCDWAREMPLSVTAEDGIFEVLLCTGGPACRITGHLYRGEPDWRQGKRPDIQWQDWFQPWTVSDYSVNTDALQWFVEQFSYPETDCD